MQSPPPVQFGGFWDRVGAALIDSVALGALMQALVLVLDASVSESAYGWILFGYVQLGWVYPTYAHGRFGCTLGKAAVGLRVVRADDFARVHYGRSFLRESPRFAMTLVAPALFLLTGFLVGSLVPYDDWVTSLAILLMMALGVAGAVAAWYIVDISYMISDPRRRTLHDQMGGTVVVSAR